MSNLKISFSTVVSTEELETIADFYEYQPLVKNNEYDKSKPDSETNKALVPNTVTKTEYAILIIARIARDVLTHEILNTVSDEMSKKEQEIKKSQILKRLEDNFEKTVQAIWAKKK